MQRAMRDDFPRTNASTTANSTLLNMYMPAMWSLNAVNTAYTRTAILRIMANTTLNTLAPMVPTASCEYRVQMAKNTKNMVHD